MKKAADSWFDLTCEELATFYGRVKPGTVLTEADCALIQALISTVTTVGEELSEKKASIARLQFLLFGPRTERSGNLPTAKESGSKNPEKEDVAGTSGETKAASPAEEEDPSPSPPKPKKKRKGHGRNGADAYPGAETIRVAHQELKVGQCCPDCQRGRLHLLPDPAKIIRLKGQPSLFAKLFFLARLRCGACGEVFTADPPEEARGPKYDATAGAIVSILKYGSGFPSTRLEQLQKDLGVPVPASVQYEIASEVADDLGPVFQELLQQAAQRELFHNDDTGAKILDSDRLRREGGRSGQPKPDQRTGTFTTSIVARGGGPDIYLYFTSRRHAGENLVELLEKRLPDLGRPIQMCDALSRNYPEALKTILANCLTHGRRKFVEVATCFPVECRRVVDDLAVVYRNDAQAKAQKMSSPERLRYHQEESGPVLNGLLLWFRSLFLEKKVEPNSALGKAITYMLNHWEKLTLFLTVPGVPLDNTICERALKMAILLRKNSLFYKTDAGAAVGDLMMSVIATCRAYGVNPFEYLVGIQEHAQEAREAPAQWLPWTYKDTLRGPPNTT